MMSWLNCYSSSRLEVFPPMRFRLMILLSLGIPCFAFHVRAEDWPGWREPRLDGTSREMQLPLHWSATENIAWKTESPGIGHSSPIVVGQRVFVTTCLEKEQQRVLLCNDRKD